MPRGSLPPSSGLRTATERWIRREVEPAIKPRSTVSHTFAAANTTERVRHRLGMVPRRWVVVSKSAACDVYDGGQAADRFYLYLKSTVSGVTVSLEIG